MQSKIKGWSAHATLRSTRTTLVDCIYIIWYYQRCWNSMMSYLYSFLNHNLSIPFEFGKNMKNRRWQHKHFDLLYLTEKCWHFSFKLKTKQYIISNWPRSVVLLFTKIPRLGLGNTYQLNEKTKMILPFVLDAASAIFWNVSKKEPKLAVATLEIKKKIKLLTLFNNNLSKKR